MPTEVFPTTLAQQRLWFLQQLLPDSPVLNLPVAIRLIGPLQVSALEQSLNTIIRRHSSLRTTFSVVGEELVQCVHGPAQTTGVTVSLVSLQDIPEDAREAMARQLAAEEACCAFDLTKGPLLRASLLACGGEDHVLLLTMPQIVADDQSIHILPARTLGALHGIFYRQALAAPRALHARMPIMRSSNGNGCRQTPVALSWPTGGSSLVTTRHCYSCRPISRDQQDTPTRERCSPCCFRQSCWQHSRH